MTRGRKQLKLPLCALLRPLLEGFGDFLRPPTREQMWKGLRFPGLGTQVFVVSPPADVACGRRHSSYPVTH